MSITLNTPPTHQIRRAMKSKRRGRPTWEMAEYYPRQGEWTESAYLDLPDDGQRVELVDGFLEFLPMPTRKHELIQEFIYFKMRDHVIQRRLGEVFRNGRRIKLREANFRLPDIMFISFSKVDPDDDNYAFGADLVVEVVSGGAKDRKRDLVEKLADYAVARFEEYWIVDPKRETISVLNLKNGKYVRRNFKPGEKAVSNVLKGFEVDVSEALAGFIFPR